MKRWVWCRKDKVRAPSPRGLSPRTASCRSIRPAGSKPRAIRSAPPASPCTPSPRCSSPAPPARCRSRTPGSAGSSIWAAPRSPITSAFWNGCAELLLFGDRRCVRGDGRELGVHQFGECAAALHEFVVSPRLDDAAVVEQQNTGRIAHRGEPVSDDEGGAAFHDLIERLRNPRLGHRIERAGGFVENEDRRVLQ